MTRYEYLKTLSPSQMAEFINLPIRCYQLCDDTEMGCANGCKWNDGKDKIEQWLNDELFSCDEFIRMEREDVTYI